MRNKRLIIALTGAAIFGLIATVSITRYLSNVRSYTESFGNVVIAREAIPLGEKITAEKLAVTRIPNGSTPEGAFDSVEKVAGRVAITDIGVREPVTSNKLAAEGASGGLPAVIPEGYRAMTVRVDDVVGVSGFVMPGAYVDVVAVINPDPTVGESPISKIVLQNIKVLASGPKIDQPKDERTPANVRTVTLQVLPDEAEKLALASNEGKLQLVMRNYGDKDAASTKGETKRSLLTGEGVRVGPASFRQEQPKTSAPPTTTQPATPAVPHAPRRHARRADDGEASVKTPPAVRSVELFEGAKRRSVEFP
jgi:pilus assembly protein CpaB